MPPVRTVRSGVIECAGRDLLFVSCTRGRAEDTDLFRSLQKLGIEDAWFFEGNENGLPACYNTVLDECAGTDVIVVFAHDDVTIGDAFLREKLAAAFERQGYAIAGVAGSSQFNTNPDDPLTKWCQPPDSTWSGAVEHDLPGGLKYMTSYGPTPCRCVVLDGLFLAVDNKQIGALRFDEQFAFDFYDVDFCLQAHCAGLALGTIGIYANHRSAGIAAASYHEAQQLFRTKSGNQHYKVGSPWLALQS
jgi:GT2 family glycosyltransferase